MTLFGDFQFLVYWKTLSPQRPLKYPGGAGKNASPLVFSIYLDLHRDDSEKKINFGKKILRDYTAYPTITSAS